jgi:hypothetical protein
MSVAPSLFCAFDYRKAAPPRHVEPNFVSSFEGDSPFAPQLNSPASIEGWDAVPRSLHPDG